KATLTVIADNQTRGFGAPNPTLTSHYAGFVNGDGPAVVNGTPNLSTTASQNSPAGNYPIQVTGPAVSAANYQFVFQPGTLTISAPARDPVLVWSNPADITYGTPL